jgi:hypothetical protein
MAVHPTRSPGVVIAADLEDPAAARRICLDMESLPGGEGIKTNAARPNIDQNRRQALCKRQNRRLRQIASAMVCFRYARP